MNQPEPVKAVPPISRPRRQIGEIDYWAIADNLRKKKGQWFLVHQGPAAVYNAIYNGITALPLDEFQVSGRNFKDGECEVYMRYSPLNAKRGLDRRKEKAEKRQAREATP